MKKLVFRTIFIATVLVALAILLYPTASDWYNDRKHLRAMTDYIEAIANMDDDRLEEILEAARTYNAKLLKKGDRYSFTDDEWTEYLSYLKGPGNVMGVLDIDKIEVKLPIFHGVSESVLQSGIGHLPGTSLPVGGLGTHSFITGHRGLPSSKLLSDLDKMVIGDTFIVYVFGQTLTYQVDDIKTVLPDDMTAVIFDMDNDFMTLVTCTPYGVNTHRLLVRGHRIPNADGDDWNTLYADAKYVNRLTILAFFMVLILPLMAVIITREIRKIQERGYGRS
jgi:sortase A